jgi:hypothetical protein
MRQIIFNIKNSLLFLLKSAYKPFYKIYSIIYLKFFVYINHIDKNKFILFTHASTADTFAIASLIDNFCQIHGEVVLIISESHIDTFRIYCESSKINYIILSEKKCIKFRSYIYEDANYQINIFKKGIIKPLHSVFYKNIPDLYKKGRIHYRDALTWVMNLDKNLHFKFPVFDEKDHKDAENIFVSYNSDFKKIILINPICYTHTGLPNNLWEDIAEVFKNKGYTVVFNLMKNSNDLNTYEFSRKFPIVHIPAYLIPLVSEKIAYTCARWGGGFDLAHSFNPKSKCLLLAFSEDIGSDENRQEDPPISSAKSLYLNFCNKEVFKILILDDLKLNKYLEDQINQIENV